MPCCVLCLFCFLFFSFPPKLKNETCLSTWSALSKAPGTNREPFAAARKAAQSPGEGKATAISDHHNPKDNSARVHVSVVGSQGSLPAGLTPQILPEVPISCPCPGSWEDMEAAPQHRLQPTPLISYHKTAWVEHRAKHGLQSQNQRIIKAGEDL